ncbi:uncharacterized protein LOC133743507 [Rosa rugosa]|uniref:uncharacterized protein LOC133737548 n=1 Tax=Rosa rugosa TaxID=74645 RepID=UPI002B40DDA9|nr:uncharacterized protein LOC133737548 [Rosa rugosa]XP_062027451.1 uncharacterized protein LOC133743507 [Rosa rugosa]
MQGVSSGIRYGVKYQGQYPKPLLVAEFEKLKLDWFSIQSPSFLLLSLFTSFFQGIGSSYSNTRLNFNLLWLLMAEVDFLGRLSHPNLVKLLIRTLLRGQGPTRKAFSSQPC